MTTIDSFGKAADFERDFVKRRRELKELFLTTLKARKTIMSDYEKMSLALLATIATGVSFLLSEQKPTGVVDWQEQVVQIVESVSKKLAALDGSK